eukprot:501620-Pyramimonas_sp.AAC.1
MGALGNAWGRAGSVWERLGAPAWERFWERAGAPFRSRFRSPRLARSVGYGWRAHQALAQACAGLACI